ncbi:MAG: hypothetical protein IKE91_02430 [Clostridia bacterium]|nr:hypothetical protein [Clostridia bacterium]
MKSFACIGGDYRNIFLSRMLEEKGMVLNCGLDSKNGSNLYNCLECNYIVFPIPFSKDEKNLYTPLFDGEIQIKECVKDVKNKIIFAGKIDNNTRFILEKNNNLVIDILKEKDFIINNAIPTAEGIIKCIIENTDITIDNSNILIIGFGNIGKKASELLSKLNANIYCYDINKHEVANIESRGYNVLNSLNNYIENMDVIVNTVPALVINKDLFKFINKETLIIDVASKPGGIDFVFAKENGFKVIQYLGIPGKVAPKTSAKYMMNIIEKYII